MKTTLPKFYLASQSPRRQTLLNQIGACFEMLLPDLTEDVETLEIALPNEIPKVYVQRVSSLKAQAALTRRNKRQLESLPILSADTIVAVEGRILGKPTNQQDAQDMSACLSGKTHEVLTAICLLIPGDLCATVTSKPKTRRTTRSNETVHEVRRDSEYCATQYLGCTVGCAEVSPDGNYYSALSVSQVRFRKLSSEEIQHYIDSGEPFGKAGAYAIQGRAAEFVEHIAGSYSGIMGLPLFETAVLLRRFGLL